MKKILSLTIVALMVIGLVAGGTWAFFSDTESSTNNSLSAGTLDLEIEGANTAVTLFSITDKAPGESGTGTADLENVGNTSGELDIAIANYASYESTGSTEYENDSIGATNVSGTATGGSTTTVVDSGASWTPDAYIGKTVYVAGKGSAVITDNDATTLTVGTEFSGAVAAADAYIIQVGAGELGGVATIALFIDVDESGTWTSGDIGLKSDETTYTYSAGVADLQYDTIANYSDKEWDAVVTMAAAAMDDLIVLWDIPTSADNTIQGDRVLFDITFTLEQTAAD